MIDWNSGVILSGSSSATNQSAVLLLDFMADNLLSQYILEPARLNNCLDLCLSNAPNLVTHVSVTDTPLSDHKLLEIFLSHDPCRPDPLVLPNFSVSSFRSLDFYKADYDRINHLLDYVNWNKLWQLCDPEEFPELLNLVLLQICEIGCPRKQASVRRRGSSVSTLSRKKRKLKLWLQLAEQNPVATAAHLESLRNQISSVHADIRDVINQDLNYREQQAVDKVHSNPKYFYSYAKKFSKHKCSIPMLFNGDKRTCPNPEEIANILQRQFISVFSDPSAININDVLFQVPSLEKPLSDDMLAFSVVDIVEAIDEIKPGAAAGPDDLSLLLLKKCKEILSKPIYMIRQHSMSTGTVPKFYKTSHIDPLHKKGSRAIAANYRPVSLTSHVIKIYEQVVRKQMVAHLEENNLLNSKQHGFRSGKSCLTQLLHHFDDIIETLSNGDDMDAIYLDYAKAFDKVDHQILLSKLQLYDFHSKIIRRIESFLTNRSQQVIVDGHMSITAPIISGVPQGTVLGPILFLIFINDIASCVSHSTLRCFADDTRIYRSINDLNNVHELQSDLEEVTKWSTRNNMALHEDKFEYICHLANKRNPLHQLPFAHEHFQYTTSTGNILTPVDQLRDLGITVSKDLSWKSHIRSSCDKVRNMAS